MRILHGVDVSYAQGAIDWRRVGMSGLVDFAYIKATEGLHLVDEQLGANHDGAKKAGIPFGVYHFFHFGIDPVAQAQHFLGATNGVHGKLLPVVDVEGGGQDHVTDLPTLIANLSAFVRTVDATLGGKRTMIYTDYGDWNGFMAGTDAFAGHPLWIAEYNHQAAPSLPQGWSDWSVWQHTSGAIVPGIPGHVDADVLQGGDLAKIAR